MLFILPSSARWFQYTSSSQTSRSLWTLMKASLKDKGLVSYVACLSAKLMAMLGLGAMVRTVAVRGGGQPNWWFVGRPIDPEDHGVLNSIGIHDASTPALQTLAERNGAPLEKPLRAPDVVWKGVEQRDRDAVLAFLGVALPAPAPPLGADAQAPAPAIGQAHAGARPAGVAAPADGGGGVLPFLAMAPPLPATPPGADAPALALPVGQALADEQPAIAAAAVEDDAMAAGAVPGMGEVAYAPVPGLLNYYADGSDDEPILADEGELEGPSAEVGADFFG